MIATLYRWLSGDRDLPDAPELDTSVTTAIPRNFLLYVASHVLTKLGDVLANPRTTLAWLLGSLGAPTWMTGLLVSVRESGSLLLQAVVARPVKRAPLRKRVWTLGSLLQGGTVLAMGAVALALDGALAGGLILALLVLFALARSLSSIASKDVLGRVVPQNRRGRATGWTTGAAGVITLAGASAALWGSPEHLSLVALATLLALAAGLWLAAAALFAGIAEPACQQGLRDEGLVARLRLLREDPLLRRFVIGRALLLCSSLSAPYLLLIAQRGAGDSSALLFGFILAGGLAGMVGGPAWGRLADVSSRRVMIVAALAAAAPAAIVAGSSHLGAAWTSQAAPMAAAFFLLSFAHEGVRLGRKTYVVNIAAGDRRTDYVAVSNSAIGLVLLVVGVLGATLAGVALELALALLALLGLFAAVFVRELPESEGLE